MNFIPHQFSFGKTDIHLLEYGDFDPQEYMEHLTEEETERYWSFKHVKRQREFIATRILRHTVFGFKHIHYDAVGAPYIKGEGFLSISHADHLVGISINKDFRTGLDLELIRGKAQQLKSKFLNETELASFETEDPTEMTKCWSAKETLYKLAGRKQIDFKKELLLRKKDNLTWEGKIINPGERISVDLHIFEYEAFIISFNSSPIAATPD